MKWLNLLGRGEARRGKRRADAGQTTKKRSAERRSSAPGGHTDGVAENPARRSSRTRGKSRGLALEHLEDRLLMAAEMPVDLVFAPGTPQEYMDLWEDAIDSCPPNGPIGCFRLGNRWTATATNPGPLTQGQPTTITWSIVPDGTSIPGFAGEAAADSNLISFLDGIYGTAAGPVQNRPWFPLFVQMFNDWDSESGVTFVFEPNDDGVAFANPETATGQLGVRGDIRIGGHRIDGNSGILAYNFFPNNGNMVIDTADNFYNNTSNNSRGLRNVTGHESGHGLGFQHVDPLDGTKLMEATVNTSFDGPQHDDILAINRHYGDRLEDNDTAATATALGPLAGGIVTTDRVSIDDDSDVDYYSFTVAAGNEAAVTVRPVGFSYLEGPQGGPVAPFDSKSQSDLTVELIDTDGVTVLALANAGGLGQDEVIPNTPLPGAGTFFIRVTGAQDAVQLYEFDLATAQTELVVINSTPVGPSIPPVLTIDVTFSADIDATTFTPADVTLVNPKGGVVLATNVVQITPRQFQVTVPAQSAAGTYTYTIGPDIFALGGAQMNQNGVLPRGQQGVAPAGDQYQASFSLPIDDTNVFPHPAAANNPVIAVNPFDSNFLVMAYEDWSTPNVDGTTFANTPPFVGTLPRVGVSYSINKGLDWRHVNLPFPTNPPGLVAASNPTLAYDSNGRLALLVGISEGRAINPSSPSDRFAQNGGLFVYTSGDNGATWSAPTQVNSTGVACGATKCFDDQAFVTADFRSTSRTGGVLFANNLYAVWTRFYPNGQFPGNPGSVGGGDIFVAQSNDFGATWSAPLRLTGAAQQPSNVPTGLAGTSAVQGPELATGPNGDVYVVYQVGTRTAMQRLTHDAAGNLTIAGAPTNPFGTGSVSSVGATLPNESFRANAFPNVELAADPLVPGRTNIYVVAANDPDGVGVGTDGGDIRFVRSIDNGQTWSAAIKVNTDETGKNQVFPWMATDERGNISIVWYDARNDALNRSFQVFTRTSTDGGLSFGAESNPPLSARSFDPNVGFPTLEVPGRLGDHIGLAARRGEAFAVWTSSNPLLPLPPNQQEIFFEGFLTGPATTATGPIVTATTPRDVFFSTEDLNGNGILDAGEDTNPNGNIDVNAPPVSGVSPPITQLTVEFSQALDEVFAEDERNFALRRTGPDGVFDTADDVQYHVTPTYAAAAIDLTDASKIGRSTVQLAINFAANPLTAAETRLPAGHYRLTVEGDDPIIGRSDVRMNNGRDKVMFFKVVDVPSFPTTSCEVGAACPSPFTPRVSEPNGTLAAALPIRLREGSEHTARGRINTTSDVDIYRVDLHSGDALVVDVDAQETLGSTLDAAVTIFDAAGAVVATSDDGTDPDSGVTGFDPAVSFVAPLTGTYFIALSSKGAIYNPVTSVVTTPGVSVGANPAYDLQVGAVPQYDTATTNNDVISRATIVRLRPGVEAVLRAQLGDNAALPNPADDVDLYEVPLSANDRLDVSVDALFASLVTPADAVLRIFDATGVELLSNSAAGDPNLTFDVTVTGTYYIGVSAKPNTMYNPLAGGTTTSGAPASIGQYDLRLEHRPLINQIPSPVYARADFVGASTGVYTAPFSTIQQAINTAAATPGRQIILLGNANDAPFVVNPTDVNVNRRTFNLNSVNTLTIESGAIIKLFNATADIQGGGTLVSQGTFSDPVVFTSFRDDTRGGDTNGDGGTTIALKEDWAGIRLLSTSNSLGSVIDSTEIRYGGGLATALARRFSPIHIDSDLDLVANAAITNTTRPTITNNLIVDSGEPAISAHIADMAVAGPGGQQGPRISGNQIDRSSINGLFVRIGTDPGTGQLRTLTGTLRLDDPTITAVMTDNLDIDGGHLILDPGTVLKMRNNQVRFRAGTGARFTSTGGTITSVQDDEAGAGANAVSALQFDTNNDGIHTATSDPLRAQPGNWGGLILLEGSTACIIDSAQNITNPATSDQTSCPAGLTPFGAAGPAIPSVIAYGGGTVPNFTGGFVAVNAITITGNPNTPPSLPTFVNIRNSVIHDNRGNAIHVTDGEVNITGNRITRTMNGGAGIGAAISVDPNTLDTRLGTAAVNIPRDPMFKGNRLEDNAFNGLFIRAGTHSRDAVYNDVDIAHILGGTINVGGAADSVLLTIRDGVVVKGCTTATTGCGATGAIVVNGSRAGQNGGSASGLRVLGTAFDEDSNANGRLDAGEDQATFGVANNSLDRGPVILTSIQDDGAAVRGYTVGADGLPGLAGVDDDGVNGVDDPGELGVGDDAAFMQADASNNGATTASPGDWQGITLTAFSNDGVKAIGTTIVPDNTVGTSATNSVSVQFGPNSNGRTVLQSTGGFINLTGGTATTAASRVISTDPALTTDDLMFTAINVGTAGNNIRVRYVVAGLNTPLLQPTVAGNDITFNLATDGAGNSITTGADLINLLARGNKIDHAEIRFAVDGVTAVAQPQHSPFFADFVDPEGPNGSGPQQPRSPNVGATNGGLPPIGNLGVWCDNNLDPSYQTTVRSGTCNGAPSNFNSSLSVTGWISDAQDVDFYAFTADSGSTIWLDIDSAMVPGSSDFNSLVSLYRVTIDPSSGARSLDLIATGNNAGPNPDPYNGSWGAQAGDALIGPLTLPPSLPRTFDVRTGSDALYFVAITSSGNNPDELCNPSTSFPFADTLTALRDGGNSTTLDFNDVVGFDIPPGSQGFCGQGNSTGQYHLEIRLATTINPDPGTTLPDTIRPQGRLNVSNSTFVQNSNTGIRSLVADPVTQPGGTAAMPVPGPMRNLPAQNNRLYPGINVFNNEFIGNNLGLGLAGQSAAAVTALPNFPQPFSLVLNNSFSGNGTAIDVIDNAAPTIMNNILAAAVTGGFIDVGITIDGSASISAAEFTLQTDGFADAIEDPTLVPHDGSVGIQVVQFDDTARLEVPFTVLTSTAVAQQVAAQIRAIRQLVGLTDVCAGYDLSAQLLATTGRGNARDQILVSTDLNDNLATCVPPNNPNVQRLDVLAIFPATAAWYNQYVFGGGLATDTTFATFSTDAAVALQTSITSGVGINVDATSLGNTILAYNLFDGTMTNVPSGQNNNARFGPARFVNPSNDLRIQIGSAAIDSALSNLADRLQTARLSLDPFDTAPGNAPRDPTNLERSTPEPTFGTERNPASGQITDHDNLDRVDDPNTPNIGAGADPFLDIGSFDLRDVKPPIFRAFAIARVDDTGEVDESTPSLTRRSTPIFRGLVTDDSNDIDGLRVEIDVDGNLDFLEGSTITRLLRDADGNPISFNNSGLLVAEFFVTSAVPLTGTPVVRARVFDRNGNVSQVQTTSISVDTVAPVATAATTNSNMAPTVVSVTYSEPILLEDDFLRAYWQFENQPGSRPFPGAMVPDSSLSLNHGTASGDVFGVSSLLATGAALVTNGTADDSLIFRAVEPGPTGATIRVQLTAAATMGVTVSDSDIFITFTAGTTASQLATFMQSAATPGGLAARRLVAVAVAPGSTGSGTVSSLPLTRLAQRPVHAAGSRSVADFRGPFDNSNLATPPRPLITVPDNANGSLDLTGEFTLSAWVNPRDFGSDPNFGDPVRRPILSKHAAGAADGGWVLALEDVLTKTASLTTSFADSNANMTISAVEPGDAGAAVTIEFIAASALSVSVTNTAISVTYATGASTAFDIINAVQANPVARTLVNLALAPNSSGLGVLTSSDAFDPRNLVRGDSLVFDFFPTTGGVQRIVSNSRIPINDWSHVAVTYNPATTEWRIYINGQLDNFGSAAALTIDQAGANNALVFAAQTPNESVNTTRVELVAGGALSVSVVGNDVSVTFVPGATTAVQVRDAINNDQLASALVRASLAAIDATGGTNDGSGFVGATGGFRPLAFTFPASAATNAAPVRIGGEAGTAASFDGFIDEVQIWARDLSSEDIALLRTSVLPPTVQIIAANQNVFDLQTDADYFNDGNEVTIPITSVAVAGNVLTLTVVDPRETVAPFGLQSDRYQVNIFGNRGTTDLAGNPVQPATLLFAVDSVSPTFLDFQLHATLSDTGLKFALGQEFGNLTTSFAGANNDVRFTAATAGPLGGAVQVELVAAAAAGVSVAGNLITVSFVAGTTRAIDVVNLVNSNAAASALVTASLPPGNNGTGLVAALAPTNLVVRAKTNQTQPFFFGQVTDPFPGSPDGMSVLLDLDGAGTFNAGTPNTRTFGGGFFTIQSIVPLSEGIHTVTARVTDLAGNFTDTTISIEVDLTAPVFTRACVVDVSDGLCKVGLLNDRASEVHIGASERLFDLSGDGNRISGNTSQFRLTGQVQGDVSAQLANPTYTYAVPVGSSFTPIDSPGGEIRVGFGTLRPDTYTFRADATTFLSPNAIVDEAGNLLDGDFPGPGPFPFQANFPTGDMNLNDDDFVWGPPLGGFIVPDVIPPRVSAVTILPTRQIIVQFDEAMDVATFTNARVLLQRDGTPSGDNVFDVTIATSFAFQSTVFANDTIIIAANAGEVLPTDLYRVLLVSDPAGLADTVGNRLDGECFNGVTNCTLPSGNGVAGGNFELRFVFAAEFFADASVPASGSGSRTSPFKTIQEAIAAAAAAPVKLDQIVATALGNGSPSVPSAAFVISANTMVDVPAGVTLRFLPEVRGSGPGPFAAAPVVVKLDRAMVDVANITGSGLTSQIRVEGTATHRVLFTSIHDDSGVDGIMGTADDMDTNGNGSATVPAKEDWAGILVRSPADTSQSSIRFAEFRYGGGKFTHPMFGEFAVSPIQLFDARPTISDNLFNHNGQAAIAADLASFRTVAGRVGPDIGVNNFNDSSINGLLLLIQPGEVVANDVTLDDANIVHVITQNVNLTGAPVSFNIMAGVKVKMFNSVFTVGAGNRFVAQGATNDPVVITSLRDDSVGAGLNLAGAIQTDTNNDGAATTRSPGNFGGIEFLANSTGRLDKVDIGFGGGTVPVPAGTPRPVNMIDIQAGAAVEVLTSDVHDALGPGISVTSAAPTIFNNQIRNLIADPNNPSRVPAAISVSPDVLGSGPDDPNLAVHGANAYVRNNLITNTVLQDPLNPMISGMEVRAGTLITPGLWDDDDITLVVRGSVQISAPGTLVVEPGVTVKLLGGTAGLRVNSDAAGSVPSLRIGSNDGDPATADPRVVLTSLRDDNVVVRGTWLGWDGVAGDTTLFATDFESGAAGFTGTGQWNLSTNRGTAPGHTATTSFYYGSGGGPTTPGSYATGGANTGTLTSAPLPLGGLRRPVTMTFNYFLQTDATGDVAEVLARPNAASPFTVVATLANTGANFVSQTVDLSAFTSPTTQIQFRFTADGNNDFLEGFFVDDIRVFSGGDQPVSVANADNDLTTAAVSDWDGIEFNQFTNEQPGAGSTIINADFKYAGQAVTIFGLPRVSPPGEFVIRDSMFASNFNGVFVFPGAPLGGPALVPGARIVNNVFVAQENIGLAVVGPSGTDSIQAVEVINNTFHRNNFGFVALNGAGPTVLNNIFSQHTTTAVFIDASSNALRASGNGPLLAFNLYATGGLLNTADITVAGTVVSPATVDSNPVFGSPGYVNVSAAYNANTAFARDFELTRGSAAVDAARSDLPARFGSNPILAPTRDQQEEFRIDAPGFPNVGAGTTPFYDIGASELVDFVSPTIPTSTLRLVPAPLSPLGDTGLQNDNKTNQTRPGFEGFVTDTSGDVVGLQVCLDVDGIDAAPMSNPANPFDDGCTVTGAGGLFRVASLTAIPNTASRLITLRATDRAGNTGVASLTIEVDLVAPTVTTFGPLAPLSNPGATPAQTNVAVDTIDVTFSERIIEETLDSRDFTLRRNGGANLLGGAAPVTVTFLGGTTYRIGGLAAVSVPEGTYVLTLGNSGVLDEAGNTGSGSPSISWVMDTTPPVPPVIAAITDDTGLSPSDRVTNDTTLIFSGTAEPNSTVTLTQIGVGVLGTGLTSAGGTWSIGAPGILFSEGTFTFTATATDLATNVSGPSGVFSVTVDTTPPAPPSTPDLDAASDSFGSIGTNTDNITNDTTPTFTGTAEPLGQVSVFANTVLLGTAPVDAFGMWAFTSGALAAGSYDITARTTDVAGNVSVSSGTLLVTIDTSTPAPTALDLTAASDSFGPNGTNSDDITNDTTPTITGVAEVNALVELFSDLTPGLLGSMVATTGTWSITSSMLGQGVHNLTARATDLAGNVSVLSAVLAITIDTMVATPSVPDLDPASDNGVSNTDNITNDNTPTFNGTAEPNSTVELFSQLDNSLGTTTTTGAGNWTLTSSINLRNGFHNITARAIDVAGNISLESAAMVPILEIDTVPPNTPPSTPDLCSILTASCFEASDSFGPNGTNTDNITNDRTPTFTGTSEPNGTVRVFDGLAFLGNAPVSAAGVWTFTSPVLADGVHIISATATDVAGNETAQSASLAVTIDTQVLAPSTPDLDAGSDTGSSSIDNITLDNTPTFTGTAEPGSRVSVFSSLVGAVAIGSTTADGAGNWTFTLTVGTLADGVHVMTASTIDVAGNQSAVSGGLAVTIDTVANPPSQPDMTAATDTFSATPANGNNVDNITRITNPTFTGTAEANSVVELLSSVDGVVGTMTANASGAWTITTTQLTAGGSALGTTHNITARTTDVAGNVSAPSTALVARIDVTALPPSVPDLDPASDRGSSNTDNVTNDTTPTLNGTAEPQSVVTILDGAVALGTVAVDAVGNWTFTTSNLAEGVHNFAARIADLAGNVSGNSGVLQVTIDTTAPGAPSVPDLTTPSDSGRLTADNLTNVTNPTFTGTAEANSTVEVISSRTGSLGTTQANATGQWTFTSPVALDNGVHAITARATDVAGNTGPTGPPLNVTIDTVPPASPTNLDLDTASDTGLSPTDNITSDQTPTIRGTATRPESDSVTLFAGAMNLGSVLLTSTNWSITAPILADGVYGITATATDLAGNISFPSATLTITVDTTAPPAPGLPDLDAASDSGLSNADNITNVTSPTLTGTAEANSRVTIFDGAATLGTANTGAGGTWTFISPVLAAGVHNITAQATDQAGNISTASPALALTIDTTTTTPVVTGITDDTGVSASDGITRDQVITINGTAEPLSRVTVRRDGVVIGTPTANAQGIWSVADPGNTITPNTLNPGTYTYSATSVDVAGNVSGTSATFTVTVDITPPTAIGLPALLPADDTGVQIDNTTRNNRPRLTGTTDPGSAIDIIDQFGNCLGGTCFGNVTFADAAGRFTVQFGNVQPDGTQAVRVRATDLAGNALVSDPIAITVDTTPPVVRSVAPTGTLLVTTSQITVTFNDDNLNATLAGNPAFAGSVLNPQNFSLIGSGGDGNFINGNERFISLATSQFLYDPGTDPFNPQVDDSLLINLRDAAGNSMLLVNDTYQFRINGTTSVQDIAGNSISGGDVTRQFVVDVPPPVVTDIRLFGTNKVVTQVDVTFNRSMNEALAENQSGFALLGAGRDRLFGTGDDILVELATPVYNDATRTITLRALRGFAMGAFFEMVIDDALADTSGNRIDGNLDGEAGGDFVSLIARTAKRALSYTDSNGDLVTLQVRRGGVMEVVRYANGEGRFLTLSQTRATSSLIGSVRQAGAGEGLTRFDTVRGTAGVNLQDFRQPPFVIRDPIAAQVREVDSVLEREDSNEMRFGTLADLIVDGMRRGR